MCENNEIATLSDSPPMSPPPISQQVAISQTLSDRYPESQLPSNQQAATSQTLCSPTSLCQPLKDHPVSIPTTSTIQLCSTQNDLSSGATAEVQMDEEWLACVVEVLQAPSSSTAQQPQQLPPLLQPLTSPTKVLTVPIGEGTSEGTSEGEGRSNTTGPTTVRIPKVNIRWLPAEPSPATGSSRPEFKRQLGIDESAEKARPAKRLPPLKRKPAAGATDGASSQSKRARGRPHHD